MSRMWQALRGLVLRGLALGAIASVCGVLANTLLPTRIPWSYPWSRDVELRAAREKIPVVRADETQRIVDAWSHAVLDARTTAEFNKGHLPGAYSAPHIEAAAALSRLDVPLSKSSPILVYCAEHDCDEGLLLCVFLRERGFEKVTLFLGGYKSWAKAGLPVERAQ